VLDSTTKKAPRVGMKRLRPADWDGPVQVLEEKGARRTHRSVAALIVHVLEQCKRRSRNEPPPLVQPGQLARNGAFIGVERTFIDMRGVWDELGVG
jgi:hypothetical protein